MIACDLNHDRINFLLISARFQPCLIHEKADLAGGTRSPVDSSVSASAERDPQGSRL